MHQFALLMRFLFSLLVFLLKCPEFGSVGMFFDPKPKLCIHHNFIKLSFNKLINETKTFANSVNLKFKPVIARPDVDELFLSNMDRYNEEAMASLETLYHSNNNTTRYPHACDWVYVGEKYGVKVEKCKLRTKGSFVSAQDMSKGSKHACVRSTGIINASPQAVFNLFLDNSRVKEYNEHIVEVKDVLHVARSHPHTNTWSKIAWARSPSYGPFKPRDFCSVVHYRKNKDGSFQIVNRPAYLSKWLPSKQFVRATILLAGNFIQPIGKDQTHVTLIAHVNPGGGADTPAAAWIINQLCAIGPPTFIKKLETTANKKKK